MFHHQSLVQGVVQRITSREERTVKVKINIFPKSTRKEKKEKSATKRCHWAHSGKKSDVFDVKVHR